MTDTMILDAAGRLLADACTPERVRAVEAGESADALWGELQASGFVDALVPADRAGGGLSLSEVFPILYMCGEHAVPVPLAQTMLARALLAAAGADIPDGPITIAGTIARAGGAVQCARVPYGRVAQWVLADHADGQLVLLPAAAGRATPTGVHASLEADIEWSDMPASARSFAAPLDARTLGAALFAAQLAGAMGRALDITVRYAGERTQFNRPIGKFQAIQHQLAVAAEHAFGTRMAAQLACHGASHLPDARRAAAGKARASEAAVVVAAITHAVHGAMGFTAEYELQLYTRRLHEWRLAYGSEAYWNERLGTELLVGDETALDFIRTRLFPA